MATKKVKFKRPWRVPGMGKDRFVVGVCDVPVNLLKILPKTATILRDDWKELEAEAKAEAEASGIEAYIKAVGAGEDTSDEALIKAGFMDDPNGVDTSDEDTSDEDTSDEDTSDETGAKKVKRASRTK
jgi:hypothetical protein